MLVLQRGFEPRTPCLKGRSSAFALVGDPQTIENTSLFLRVCLPAIKSDTLPILLTLYQLDVSETIVSEYTVHIFSHLRTSLNAAVHPSNIAEDLPHVSKDK